MPFRVRSLEELGAPAACTTLLNKPYGIVLVVGPTGSGKSTTLAAMIDRINDTKPVHILTIEDPIEFVHESKKCLINQREVHRDTHGFNEALRSPGATGELPNTPVGVRGYALCGTVDHIARQRELNVKTLHADLIVPWPSAGSAPIGTLRVPGKS